MTTVQAASSAMPSVASVPRRAAARREVVLREVVLREAVLHHVRLRGTQAVVAVVPAAMRMITTHRAAVVVEAAGDSFCHKTDKTFKTMLFNMLGWQRLATACRCLTRLK